MELAKLLKKQKVQIDCYGYGDYKKYKLIQFKKKLYNISFKKFNINLRTKIKNYDLLIHLSEREGLPVAVMECLAEGLPVICKKIRGNCDLIKDRFNGFFINSFKEIPNKISYLNLEKNILNEIRYNALNSIKKNFSKKEINLLIYKIIIKNFKNMK